MVIVIDRDQALIDKPIRKRLDGEAQLALETTWADSVAGPVPAVAWDARSRPVISDPCVVVRYPAVDGLVVLPT